MDAHGSETHEAQSAANGTAPQNGPEADPETGHRTGPENGEAPAALSPAARLGRIETVLRTVLSQVAPVEGDRDGVARRQDLARLHGSLAQKMKSLQDEVAALKSETPDAEVETISEEADAPAPDTRLDAIAQQLETIEGYLFVQLDERLESFTRHMAAEATPERFTRVLLLVLALSGASLALAIAGLFF